MQIQLVEQERRSVESYAIGGMQTACVYTTNISKIEQRDKCTLNRTLPSLWLQVCARWRLVHSGDSSTVSSQKWNQLFLVSCESFV